MKLKQINKDILIENLVDWHTEAYYANRSSFEYNDTGRYRQKLYKISVYVENN
jgi:hypothetical protein